MSGGRQGSIASFFTRTPTEARPAIATATAMQEVKDELIDLTSVNEPTSMNDENEGPSLKRRKFSPKSEATETKTPHLPATPGKKPGQERLKLDLTQPYSFPGPDHPSYHPPLSPDHNHPFPIPPPSQSLVDALSFSQSPRAILKPNLNLDLLYFDHFISSPGSRELYDYLLDSLPWYRVKYTVRGININTPRWTTVFGKDSSTKSWSGYNVKPRAIPEILLRLMEIGMSQTFIYTTSQSYLVHLREGSEADHSQSRKSPGKPTTSL